MTATQSNSFCEAWVNNQWQVVPVLFARARPELIVRCLECHGHIVLMTAGPKNIPRAHAEHRPGHSGCSLGHYFDGARKPNPHPVPDPPKSASGISAGDIIIEDEESGFPEGREHFRMHRSLERDGRIARKAKAKRLTETGKLECDVCNLDFAARYGERGRGFIEAHHKTPIASLSGVTKTKVRDLALVCSNCHRMLHRGDPILDVDRLRASLLPIDGFVARRSTV